MTGSSAEVARPVPAPRARDLSSSTSPQTSSEGGDGDNSRPKPAAQAENGGGGDIVRKKRKAVAPPPPTRADNIVVAVENAVSSSSSTNDLPAAAEEMPQAPAATKPAVRSSSTSTGTRSKLRQLLSRRQTSTVSSSDLRSPETPPEQPLRSAFHLQRQQNILAVLAINSTLVNSTASLPGREFDLSPVRPSSALSNSSSAASTVAAKPTHKKRRAPLPPGPPAIR
jgi:hypothetical protein